MHHALHVLLASESNGIKLLRCDTYLFVKEKSAIYLLFVCAAVQWPPVISSRVCAVTCFLIRCVCLVLPLSIYLSSYICLNVYYSVLLSISLVGCPTNVTAHYFAIDFRLNTSCIN